jgi:hypothetical protein
MNRPSAKRSLLVVALCLLFLLLINTVECKASDYLLTDAELDDLLGPIALYPDPLLAQMLPASTYPSEIVDAAAWLGGGGDISGIDGQDWDESVKAIAYYPDVLNMMAANIDWTADLGDAFVNQPEDVMNSVQRLRWQARSLGNLESNDQETVSIDGDYIEIIPAQPEYIYLPQYNPTVIYVRRWTPGVTRFIMFGRRMPIGGWLTLDFDWHNHHVIYHGWNRPGWVNNARPHIHIKNVYISKSRPYIDQAWRHDASHGNPGRYTTSRRGGTRAGKYTLPSEIRGSDMISNRPSTGVFSTQSDVRTFSNRGKESLGISRTPSSSPARVVGKPQTTLSPRTFSTRGKAGPVVGGGRSAPSTTVIGKPEPTASPRVPERQATPVTGNNFSRPGTVRSIGQTSGTVSSVFEGYRGAGETRVLSNRGQASRQSSVKTSAGAAPRGRGGAPSDSSYSGDGKDRR